MRKWLAIGAAAIFALLVSACATHEVYENPSAAAEETAVLSGSSEGAALADLLKIDGASCRLMGNTIEVLPGEHTVDFRISKRVVHKALPLTDVYEHILTFEAEAGHTYTLDGEFARRVVHVWIADNSTGEHVAEVHLKRG